jgi:type II secretory pathway pseudopilin PulG
MASSNPNKSVARGEPIDAIPMKKSSPMMVLAILAGIAALIGVVVFSMSRGKAEKATNQKHAEQAAQAQAAADSTANMTPEEQKRHLEITQKSLALWKEQQAAEDAKKKAAEEAAKEKEAAAATPAGGAPIAKAGAPAGGGNDEAPAPKKKPSKKEMDALEGLGSDIAGQLNK